MISNSCFDNYDDSHGNVSCDEWRCTICGEFYPPDIFKGKKICPGCVEDSELSHGFFSREAGDE